MKIFTSAIEGICATDDKGEKVYFSKHAVENGTKLKWNLMSFFYLRNHVDNAFFIRDNSEAVMIDSGAHTFQFGKKVDWEAYTHEYARFIKSFDDEKVVGYFEMDVENVTGYEKVLELRKILETVSNKIIPVWHPLRGIDDFEKTCVDYSGKIVAIGGFKNTDIKDSQYLSFMKTARKHGCKIHCLGMSRCEVLDAVPFDYTDSATWVTATNMGHPLDDGRQHQRIGDKRFPKATGLLKLEQFRYNYEKFASVQKKYHDKWKKECRD